MSKLRHLSMLSKVQQSKSYEKRDIFVWDLLRHCIECFIFLAVGLQFRSDLLLIFNMVWPCIFWRTVFVCPQSPYRDNDWYSGFLSIVCCHACCMWHWAIHKHLDLWIHLRSLPCAFSRRSVNQLIAHREPSHPFRIWIKADQILYLACLCFVAPHFEF